MCELIDKQMWWINLKLTKDCTQAHIKCATTETAFLKYF